MNYKEYVITFALLGTITGLQGAQTKRRRISEAFHAIILPGQNGSGGEVAQANGVVNAQSVKRYGVPKKDIDLGQANCIQHFEEQFSQDKDAQKAPNILYGASQGTATLVNWLATKSNEGQEAIAKHIVLESVLGTPESAIMHTASNVTGITYLPFARLWSPWVAKAAAFIKYKPYGKNVLESITQISHNIPIVMLHDEYDFQLSVNDARRAYNQARRAGHNKVYLIETQKGRHLNLTGGWERDPCNQKDDGLIEEVKVVNTRIKNGSKENCKYQPSVEEVQTRIDRSTRCQFWTRNAIDALAFTAGAAWVYSKYLKHKEATTVK